MRIQFQWFNVSALSRQGILFATTKKNESINTCFAKVEYTYVEHNAARVCEHIPGARTTERSHEHQITHPMD